MSRFLSLALLATLTLTSTPARAYNTLKYGWSGSTEITWAGSSMPVPWTLHPNGCADLSFDKAQAALAAAFASWQAVNCAGISFSYKGTATSAPSLGIWVRFQNGAWDPSVDGAAAYSVTTDYGSNGDIRRNEIVYNDAEISWTDQDVGPYSTQQDIQGVGAHEIGHSIGLDHSWIRQATMFFSGGSAELRDLDPDDQRGACYLYPTQAFTQGQTCDACTTNSHCAAGDCVGYPDGNGYCGKACTSDAQCPEHAFCYPEGINQCASDNVRCDQGGGNIPMGSYCWGMEGCETGVCLPLPTDAYCSKECNPQNPTGTCPSGWTCMGEGYQGYCIQAGQVPYGGACTTHLECATSVCAQICPNTAVCVKECTSAAQCPGASPCEQGLCLPTGSTPFGGPCSCAIDCTTGFCTGVFAGNYCSRTCSTDADCPESTCQSNGICAKPAAGTGDVCKQDLDCGVGMFCKYTSGTHTQGTCAPECDPVADSGCPAGQGCVWYYMGWVDRVVGECVPQNGSAGYREDCMGAPYCQVQLTCYHTEQGPALCLKDCKTTSAWGCAYDETCTSLGDASDPKRGLCVPKPTVTPDPGPDVVTPPDTTQPDTTQPQPDTTQPQPDSTQPQPDRAQPQPDTTIPLPDAGAEQAASIETVAAAAAR